MVCSADFMFIGLGYKSELCSSDVSGKDGPIYRQSGAALPEKKLNFMAKRELLGQDFS
jgi:hypothetical protein